MPAESKKRSLIRGINGFRTHLQKILVRGNSDRIGKFFDKLRRGGKTAARTDFRDRKRSGRKQLFCVFDSLGENILFRRKPRDARKQVAETFVRIIGNGRKLFGSDVCQVVFVDVFDRLRDQIFFCVFYGAAVDASRKFRQDAAEQCADHGDVIFLFFAEFFRNQPYVIADFPVFVGKNDGKSGDLFPEGEPDADDRTVGSVNVVMSCVRRDQRAGVVRIDLFNDVYVKIAETVEIVYKFVTLVGMITDQIIYVVLTAEIEIYVDFVHVFPVKSLSCRNF